VDVASHEINHYPVKGEVGFVNSFSLNRHLSATLKTTEATAFERWGKADSFENVIKFT